MKVLLTGAFGNIGTSALLALLAEGHEVRCFDLRTEANEGAAQSFEDGVEVVWGDLRDAAALAGAVAGREVVVHLGFLIPKLSVTGLESETVPDLAWEVNVGGTFNLLNAMRAQRSPPRLVFASSYHVYGLTQGQAPPRQVDDPVEPVEHYARHKVACEWMVKASGLTWTILRFSASLPISLTLDPYMFEIPLSNRMEYVHTRDVGVAVANAVVSDEVWGKTLLIGGGADCQLTYGEIVEGVLGALGIGMLPAEAFGREPFATDWVDSQESQRLLRYQSRTFDDYLRDMQRTVGWRRPFIRLFRPFVRRWLLRRSPYWKQKRP
jgi:nucleoside-diphosphate-sugar epimerase